MDEVCALCQPRMRIRTTTHSCDVCRACPPRRKAEKTSINRVGTRRPCSGTWQVCDRIVPLPIIGKLAFNIKPSFYVLILAETENKKRRRRKSENLRIAKYRKTRQPYNNNTPHSCAADHLWRNPRTPDFQHNIVCKPRHILTRFPTEHRPPPHNSSFPAETTPSIHQYKLHATSQPPPLLFLRA